jgi:hypothetical protein
VNNTMPDGSFTLRLVVKNLVPENEQLLTLAFSSEDLNITSLELV